MVLGYDIRMRADNPDVMYVTDDGAGAFTSTDGGSNWTPINDGILEGGIAGGASVFSLTVDPNNLDRVWIGSSLNSAVYRSDNGGQSWTRMSNGIEESQATIRPIGHINRVSPRGANPRYSVHVLRQRSSTQRTLISQSRSSDGPNTGHVTPPQLVACHCRVHCRYARLWAPGVESPTQHPANWSANTILPKDDITVLWLSV